MYILEQRYYLVAAAGLVATERAVEGLGDGPSFTVTDAQHLPYSIRAGYQVLLPGIKFNCYGNLTSWSALVVGVRYSYALKQIVFQVWRPTGSGWYKLVGFDEILVPLNSLPKTDHENEYLAYYYILNTAEDRTGDFDLHSNQEENKPLYFKPGDVIGILIQSFITTAHRQMYITYHNQTASDPDHQVMDMFFTVTDGSVAQCEINTCSEEVPVIQSIVPNIFFTYGILTASLLHHNNV